MRIPERACWCCGTGELNLAEVFYSTNKHVVYPAWLHGDLWGIFCLLLWSHEAGPRYPMLLISTIEATTTQPETVFFHIVANESLTDSSVNVFVYSSARLSTIILGYEPLHLPKQAIRPLFVRHAKRYSRIAGRAKCS